MIQAKVVPYRFRHAPRTLQGSLIRLRKKYRFVANQPGESTLPFPPVEGLAGIQGGCQIEWPVGTRYAFEWGKGRHGMVQTITEIRNDLLILMHRSGYYKVERNEIR